MKITAIIAEFNPFHNGHAEIIRKAREITGSDYVIILMSGDYVQRGAPAILDRHTRCRAALMGGADLVIAQPTRYCTSSAEDYARWSIRLLDALGIVDFLAFGSECGDISKITACAQYLSDESESFKEKLRAYQKTGLTFPKARAMAVPQFGEILSAPNNILGVEYVKALIHTGSQIKPITIQRVGARHHDADISMGYASASSIRNLMVNHASYISDLSSVIPKDSLRVQLHSAADQGIVESNDFSLLLAEKIWSAPSPDYYLQYQDVTSDLAGTIFKNREKCCSFDAFAESLKNKSLTRTHINRALLHITLQLKARGGRLPESEKGALYAHVLGCRSSASSLLGLLSEHAEIPIITRPGVDREHLEKEAQDLLDEETRVSNLYNAVRAAKNGNSIINTLSRRFITI
ncbi:MAG: nucleotidyltransferase family protein [Lachnospiraceae bacterium]|nr:nucleotidyltransferase family protein [Lachnospiraceae bacterium]